MRATNCLHGATARRGQQAVRPEVRAGHAQLAAYGRQLPAEGIASHFAVGGPPICRINALPGHPTEPGSLALMLVVARESVVDRRELKASHAGVVQRISDLFVDHNSTRAAPTKHAMDRARCVGLLQH